MRPNDILTVALLVGALAITAHQIHKKRQAVPNQPLQITSVAPAKAFRTPLETTTVPVLQQNTSQRWPIEDQNVKDIFKWTHVREEEATNCGYHALKNLLLWFHDKNLYLNQAHLIESLKKWIPLIYQKRAANLKQYAPAIDVSSPEKLLAALPTIKSDLLKNFINKNDGHIKTEFLDIFEEYILINSLPDKNLQNNIIIMSDAFFHYPTSGIDPETLPMIIGEEEYELFMKSQKRLAAFCKNSDDKLGILWTEKDYHHWIAFGITKKKNHITMHYFNSREDLLPQHHEAFLKSLLECSKQAANQPKSR